MSEERLTISNLQNGAVVERADWELQKILKNIADPNTDPLKKRELTIKLSIKPDETRKISDIEITCSSKVAPAKPIKTRMFMSEDGDGGFVPQELSKNQMVGQVSVEETAESDKVRQLKREAK
jgi:hypothetical protein